MIKIIKKLFLLLILSFNFVFTQYPSASFESNVYSIDANYQIENSERPSIALQIENPYSEDLGGITIFLYANPSVIKFDLESVSWNSDTPFQHETLIINVDNDTLKIAAISSQEPETFSVPLVLPTKIFDISFDIVGVADENTLLEFITFQLGGSNPNYTENTIPTNINLVGEDSEEPSSYGCMDDGNCTVDTCGYDSPYSEVPACNYDGGAIQACDNCCEYVSCAGCDGIPNSGLVVDECGNCNGDGYESLCVGTDDCAHMDCSGYCGVEGDDIFVVIDECGICGGGNYESLCVETDDCVVMDCAGVCSGSDLLTPCGDCSVSSNCNISVGITTMDNNFRKDNIEIPISLDYMNLSTDDLLGLEGFSFELDYENSLLELDSAKTRNSLIDQFGLSFNTDTLRFELFAIDELFQSFDNNETFINLSFNVIDSVYTLLNHGITTDIEIILTELNAIPISNKNTGTLTIYTKACIDPFASTIDYSNFICDCNEENELCEVVSNDACDENGILEGSNIFNDGCILPVLDPQFENILDDILDENNITTEEKIQNVNYGACSDDTDLICFNNNDCVVANAGTICDLNYYYTLTVPDGTTIGFPTERDTLDIRSSPVDIIYLPDVAPGAQLVGSLVGLYPFGTTFDPPVNFIFQFNDFPQGPSKYDILHMEDLDTLQAADWKVVGTCSGGVLGLCEVDTLKTSGLFIVMYGENLSTDETIIPSNFNLYRNYPNPFNPITTLEFDVGNSGIVDFTVYNINGQIVDLLPSKYYTPGNYQIKWEALGFPSGIYLIQMRTKSFGHIQKVMLLK